MIKLYNSLTKKKEEFTEIKKGEVRIYSCGPTVYNHVHIGNLRAFMLFDILSRTFKYFGYEVINIMNLTDVDDKTIANSKKEFASIKDSNKRLKDFTEKYSKIFFEDIAKLNIENPTEFIRATDSIKEMEFLINELFEKDFAYVGDDGIYFDISKDKKYGQLMKLDLKNQMFNKENRMVSDEYDKDNVSDFALWKFKKEEDEPAWKIKVGDRIYEGRPGWHIECSAMNYKAHGKNIDIHTGGVDLKFPHHENEIAQSECALDHKYVNYWMHNEHLLVDMKKMSKSLGNFHTLYSLEKKGYSGLALREVFLRAHYRKQMNFTFDSLEAGIKNIKRINDFYEKMKNLKVDANARNEIRKIYDEKLDMFDKALEDDLNTPIAISALDEFMNEINRIENFSKEDIELVIEFLLRTDRVLGLLEKEEMIPKEILEIAKQRALARLNGDWDESDRLRDEIKSRGYNIKDDKSLKEGYIISEIK